MRKASLYWLAAIVLLAAPVTPEAAVLESPAATAVLSGLGFISGWKCDARHITVVLDENGEHLSVAMHQARGDLRAVCGGTIRHGFIQQLNWALLSDGEHVVVAYDDGVEFARATFSVGSTGEEFLTGAAGRARIAHFPARGAAALVEWNESTQHFEVRTVVESAGRAVYDRDWWRQYNHDLARGTYATAAFLYAAAPDIAACAPGALSLGAKNRALTAANQIRALHGLSAVGYRAEATPQVQATALLGAANTAPLPPVTSDMACYTAAGATGAQDSLLGRSRATSIRSCIWRGGSPGAP